MVESLRCEGAEVGDAEGATGLGAGEEFCFSLGPRRKFNLNREFIRSMCGEKPGGGGGGGEEEKGRGRGRKEAENTREVSAE